jgi:hypothetical protein
MTASTSRNPFAGRDFRLLRVSEAVRLVANAASDAPMEASPA